MRFQDRIENITAIDQVATPSSFADVDARSGTVVNGTVTNGDPGSHRNLNTSWLSFNASNSIDQTICNLTIRGVVVRLRARRQIDFVKLVGLSIAKKWVPDSVGIANKTNT